MLFQTSPGTNGAAASSTADTPPSTGSSAPHSSAEPQQDTYWALRCGLARHLPKLHDAAQVMAQIGERM